MGKYKWKYPIVLKNTNRGENTAYNVELADKESCWDVSFGFQECDCILTESKCWGMSSKKIIRKLTFKHDPKHKCTAKCSRRTETWRLPGACNVHEPKHGYWE